MSGLIYEKTPRRSDPAVWTHRMLYGRRSVSVVQTIEIVRKGPPKVGALFFDADGHLIFIITAGFVQDPMNGRTSNHFTWRRVYCNGTLSKTLYSDYWYWGNYRDQVRRRKGGPKGSAR